jgi:hypothetical protein
VENQREENAPKTSHGADFLCLASRTVVGRAEEAELHYGSAGQCGSSRIEQTGLTLSTLVAGLGFIDRRYQANECLCLGVRWKGVSPSAAIDQEGRKEAFRRLDAAPELTIPSNG